MGMAAAKYVYTAGLGKMGNPGKRGIITRPVPTSRVANENNLSNNHKTADIFVFEKRQVGRSAGHL